MWARLTEFVVSRFVAKYQSLSKGAVLFSCFRGSVNWNWWEHCQTSFLLIQLFSMQCTSSCKELWWYERFQLSTSQICMSKHDGHQFSFLLGLCPGLCCLSACKIDGWDSSLNLNIWPICSYIRSNSPPSVYHCYFCNSISLLLQLLLKVYRSWKCISLFLFLKVYRSW